MRTLKCHINLMYYSHSIGKYKFELTFYPYYPTCQAGSHDLYTPCIIMLPTTWLEPTIIQKHYILCTNASTIWYSSELKSLNLYRTNSLLHLQGRNDVIKLLYSWQHWKPSSQTKAQLSYKKYTTSSISIIHFTTVT